MTLPCGRPTQRAEDKPWPGLHEVADGSGEDRARGVAGSVSEIAIRERGIAQVGTHVEPVWARRTVEGSGNPLRQHRKKCSATQRIPRGLLRAVQSSDEFWRGHHRGLNIGAQLDESDHRWRGKIDLAFESAE
jgi:hypothetical protein